MGLIAKLIRKWERAFEPKVDLGYISREKQYEINAASKRNVVYDKKGNLWRLRDAL